MNHASFRRPREQETRLVLAMIAAMFLTPCIALADPNPQETATAVGAVRARGFVEPSPTLAYQIQSRFWEGLGATVAAISAMLVAREIILRRRQRTRVKR